MKVGVKMTKFDLIKEGIQQKEELIKQCDEGIKRYEDKIKEYGYSFCQEKIDEYRSIKRKLERQNRLMNLVLVETT